MTKKHIFLPVVGLLVLSIGYYFFSFYQPDNLPNESETIYPANEIIKLNTDIYSPNENDQEQTVTADTTTPTDEDSNLPSEADKEQTADTTTPTDEDSNLPSEADKEQTADTTTPTDEDSNLPSEADKEQTADTTTPTDEDSNLPNESDQQNVGEKYTVFVFYDEDDLSLDSPPGGNMLIPFFEVDLKNKTIKGIYERFEEQETYYRIADGREVYPKAFGKGEINPFFYDYETKYIAITNDFEQGEYFIDKKVALGEKPKTAANIKLFFEAFFRSEWGRQFYRENILNDLDNIERRTGHTITKITDMDKDGNLEYWLRARMNKGYDISDDIYEVVDGEPVFIGYVYFGH